MILAHSDSCAAAQNSLTRPGRFDRRVPVELPDLKGREEILKVHARKIKTEPNIDYSQVAKMASGTSGALGYTMQVESGNHYLMSKEKIEIKIATFTGGRAAEKVVFGSVTTGEEFMKILDG